jgi:putative phosphoesterase
VARSYVAEARRRVGPKRARIRPIIDRLAAELRRTAPARRHNAASSRYRRLVRVAALYDIHGNLPALEGVLREIDRERVDAVVVGGDVVAGPFPEEVLTLLDAPGRDVRFIRGNADREFGPGSKAPEPWRTWLAERIGPATRERLEAWPEQLVVDVEGLGPTLFCHATPRNDEEIFTDLTPDEIVAEMMSPADQSVVVVGHTHMQTDRRVGTTRIVNAGSVGIPYEGRRGAYWALLGPDVDHRRTEYDVDDLLNRVRASGFPDPDGFYGESLLNLAVRADVAAFFEGVAGRPR